MDLFDISALLITLAALFSYINFRFIKLPTTIGLMIFSFLMALSFMATDFFFPGAGVAMKSMVNQIDFNETLMHGMLGFLLFAGALHVNINDLEKRKLEVIIYASVGVLLSTVIIATLVYFLCLWLNITMDFMHCLIFGALISPTDPIAVLGLLKKAKAPKSQEIQLTGESLFNDGFGVVVFITLLNIAYPHSGHGEATFMEIAKLFLVEAVGGLIFGFVIGWIAYKLLKSIEDYNVEIMITLSLVMGGYALASALHTSGPLAMVVAGLLIGNHGRKYAMGDEVRKHIDTFWMLLDNILNALLFVLIGLEVMVITMKGEFLLAGLIIIPVCLLARFVSVGTAVSIMKIWKKFSNNLVRILTWAGLRGGISVALALSLPDSPERDFIITVTYAVVLFSIIVQGLTVKYLIKPDPTQALTKDSH